jgi:hypothetical protein
MQTLVSVKRCDGVIAGYAGSMWWILACSLDSAPEPPPASIPMASPPAGPRRFVLSGRLDADLLVGPDLPGRAELKVRCGAQRPCRRERWSPDAASPEQGATFWEQIGTQATWEGEKVRTQWRNLGLLRACLADPFGLPPAGDPQGRRSLLGEGWLLQFSGKNLCTLEGDLRLDLRADRVDLLDLRAGGLPWLKGGRAVAQEQIWSWLEVVLPADWQSFTKEERDEIYISIDMSTHTKDPMLAARLKKLRARLEGLSAP